MAILDKKQEDSGHARREQGIKSHIQEQSCLQSSWHGLTVAGKRGFATYRTRHPWESVLARSGTGQS